MTANDHREGGPVHYGYSATARPPGEEVTLKTEKIQIERKTFVFSLRENPRGRFLRITEDVGGRRDAIIVPAPGLDEFSKTLGAIAQAAAELAPESATP